MQNTLPIIKFRSARNDRAYPMSAVFCRTKLIIFFNRRKIFKEYSKVMLYSLLRELFLSMIGDCFQSLPQHYQFAQLYVKPLLNPYFVYSDDYIYILYEIRFGTNFEVLGTSTSRSNLVVVFSFFGCFRTTLSSSSSALRSRTFCVLESYLLTFKISYDQRFDLFKK